MLKTGESVIYIVKINKVGYLERTNTNVTVTHAHARAQEEEMGNNLGRGCPDNTH